MSRYEEEMLQLAQQQIATSTRLAELYAGGIVNHVLDVWSGTFPSEGWITQSYPVPAGCIRVRNLSDTNSVTVSSDGPANGTPGGTGTAIVAPGVADVIPLGSRQFTLYGTADDQVSIQVYSCGPWPVSGS